MATNRISRHEKLWLAAMLVICALPVGFAWLYQHQNGVPQYKFVPRVIPEHNAENVLLSACSSYIPLAKPGKLMVNAVDPVVENTEPPQSLQLYSPRYSRYYPLPAKIAFLRTNNTSLALLRTGLSQPYAYTNSGLQQSDTYWGNFRTLARLLLVEAHARGQQGDFLGATDSLLTAYHLAAILPREAPLDAVSTSGQIRGMVRIDFRQLAPHLRASEAISAAKAIECWNKQIPSLAQSLEWEKRAELELLQRVVEQNDLRPLYIGQAWACADLQANVCGIAPAKMQADIQGLSPQLQLRLAWQNKKRLVENITHNFNSNIAAAKKPYSEQMRLFSSKKSYFDDPLAEMEHGGFQSDARIYTLGQTFDRLLSTSLALNAFRLEHGHYPAKLKELVPRYLAQVPLDPYSGGQPLCYRNQKLKYETGTQLVDKKGRPLSKKQIAALGPDIDFAISLNPPRSIRKVPIYSTSPFTLYSIGLNSHDDGGIPCQDRTELYDFKRRYRVKFSDSALPNTDLVAGVNGVY